MLFSIYDFLGSWYGNHIPSLVPATLRCSAISKTTLNCDDNNGDSSKYQVTGNKIEVNENTWGNLNNEKNMISWTTGAIWTLIEGKSLHCNCFLMYSLIPF